MPVATGQKLLRFDRKLGARFVAGADEAGRGSLAGPLVVAGVLLDYATLRHGRVRPLARLNDSKQLSADERERLFRAVLGCAEAVAKRWLLPVESHQGATDQGGVAEDDHEIGAEVEGEGDQPGLVVDGPAGDG